jgi:hypothetical protein
MMYRVKWEIDVEAETSEQAVREAKRIQLDPESTANVFIVHLPGQPNSTVDVDLDWMDEQDKGVAPIEQKEQTT